MRRGRAWIGLAAVLGAGGALSPPFWSGVGETALILTALVLLTVARELARLAVGCALGLRPAFVELGEGRVVARLQTGRLRWLLHERPIVSVTLWQPPASDRGLRLQLIALAAVRPAVTAGVLLILRAAHVPLSWEGGGAAAGYALARAAEGLLVIGLVPFAIRGQSVVPFESDGLKLVRAIFARTADPGPELGRFYFAGAREAMLDGDPARAVALCREGIARYGATWGDVLRANEAAALSQAGDRRAALAAAEAQLAGDLPPLARMLALNNWSWYAFLRRDEADRRLAERRSADALLLKPDFASVAGTRGAVLLWQGRVAEALPLLVRATDGAHTSQARDINLCLKAMAQAAAGDVGRARGALAAVRQPTHTDGLWTEAERAVEAAAGAEVVLRAARGTRAIALTADGLELREPGRVRRLAAVDVRRADIGRTARGRARIVVHGDRGGWRLSLADADLTWARMLFSRLGGARPGTAQTVAAAEGTASLETQERAYQERARALAAASPRRVLFIGSLVASVAVSAAWSPSGKYAAMLLAIIFVHELGHWLAMRAFGHDDAQIAFIPMLGAATTTRKPFQKRWQEVVMLLAGPVPGLVAGIVACALPATRHHPDVRMAALMAVGINALNLLPLHPLDGGRILHAVVTAGRPRLDLAFKTAAALLFLVAGFTRHESLLTGLGLLGLIFWPQARRLAKLERGIRRTPGFDPRLPPEQRRAYVFRALAHEPALQAKDWGATVASLEGPLAYRALPAWKIVAGTLVVAVFGAGLVLGSGLLLRRRWGRGRQMAVRACPDRGGARSLTCADAPGMSWPAPVATPHAPNPNAAAVANESDDETEIRGFVWCDAASAAAAAGLRQELDRLQLARQYCAAYPWELPGGKLTAAQEAARSTLWLVRMDRFETDDKEWARALAAVEHLPGFDDETARLVHEVAVSSHQQIRPALDALSARLGAAPGGTCDGLGISNLRHPTGAPASTLAFAVTMTAPSQFAPLGALLCQAGCRVSVLPAAPDDDRVGFCR
ncbi:MAG TPA: site-2 protease family protein [Polyangia bacterium]|nr:site-2 protease family protein [Polyangia bacterium]